MKDEDYDEGYLNFKPYRLELSGPHQLRIPLTDSEIRERRNAMKIEGNNCELQEMQSRLATLDSGFQGQSVAAEELIEDIRKRLCFTFDPESPVMELALETQEAIWSMVKTQRLCQKLRGEIIQKRDEELRESENL